MIINDCCRVKNDIQNEVYKKYSVISIMFQLEMLTITKNPSCVNRMEWFWAGFIDFKIGCCSIDVYYV